MLKDSRATDEGDGFFDDQRTMKHDLDDSTQSISKKLKVDAKSQEMVLLEDDLHIFRAQRLEESRLRIYIPPMAKANLQARDDALFPLMDKVQEFLASEREVMLVLGDSGAGKSTFNLELEHTLWSGYKEYGPIPLYINLPFIDNPSQDLIEKHLQHHNYSEDQICDMKLHREFVLICDGYDESQLKVNIHTSNQFNQTGQWKVKVVISCRTQYLGQGYHSRFLPQQIQQLQQPRANLFQEAVIAPFSKAQIEEYTTRYVPLEPRPWVVDDYMRMLTTVPKLMELVSNPFLLTLALETLPVVTELQQDFSTVRITRVQLYDIFVLHWLGVNKRRLESNALSVDDRVVFDQLLDAGFTSMGIDYSTRLASAVFEQQDGNPVIQYTKLRDKNTWVAEFFGSDPEVRLLQEASPLTRSGSQFQFLHRSILEYFYSRTIYDPAKINDELSAQRETILTTTHFIDTDSPLYQRNLLVEPSIIQFLCERVEQNLDFEQELRSLVDQSKTDSSARTAATNAITILVRAGVRFNGADLRDIQIPGADLSNGQFDYAQFQGANLTGVNLARSWLRQVDMSGAKMEGVQFGELPYLASDDYVTSCNYSPDGKLLVVSLSSGAIDIYKTTTWSKVRQLTGHVGGTRDCAFSPDGQRIVSAGKDKTVRVWDMAGDDGEALLVLEGHTGALFDVSFSPCGKHITSCSYDETIRLWSSETGECLFVLEGHTDTIRNVIYSSDGRTLVSGSTDKTIRFWNAETGEPGAIWTSPVGEVNCLASSPDGRWIASGHRFGHLQLWDTAIGEARAKLVGHTHHLTSVVFSPSGQWLASSSGDRTVKLWDVSAGTLVTTLTGYTNDVYTAAFSPNERQIASGGADKKVRLMDVNSSESMSSGIKAPSPQNQHLSIVALAYTLDGEAVVTVDDDLIIRRWNPEVVATGEGGVGGGVCENDLFTDDLEEMYFLWCAAFSPDRRQIAASFDEGPIRLSSVQHVPGFVLRMKGHLRAVTTMAYSPCGRWLLSGCLDKEVRLWDLHEDSSALGQGGHVLVHLEESSAVAIECVEFSPSGHQIAVEFSTGTVSLFDTLSRSLLVASTKKLQASHRNERYHSLRYSPDGRHIAMGSAAGPIYLWNIVESVLKSDTGIEKEEPGVLVQLLKGHDKGISCLAFSICGTWIASGSIDETVRLWHRQSDREGSWLCVTVVRGFSGCIRDIAWNPVMPMEFVTACKDASVRVWGVSSRVDGEGVKVRFLWGSDLGILCAADMILEGVVGLELMSRKLLVQRGAVEILER